MNNIFKKIGTFSKEARISYIRFYKKHEKAINFTKKALGFSLMIYFFYKSGKFIGYNDGLMDGINSTFEMISENGLKNTQKVLKPIIFNDPNLIQTSLDETNSLIATKMFLDSIKS